MQPTYQQVMVKPGTAPVYAQPSSARAAVQSAQQSSSIAQQQQQSQQAATESCSNGDAAVCWRAAADVRDAVYGSSSLCTATGCKFSQSVSSFTARILSI